MDVSPAYQEFIRRVCRPPREGRVELLQQLQAVKSPAVLFGSRWTPRTFRSVTEVDGRSPARAGTRRHTQLEQNFDGGPPLMTAFDIEETPFPADADAIATFASDLDGVGRAEVLAFEVARALVPWGGSQPKRLVWSPCRYGGNPALTRADAVLKLVDFFTSQALEDGDITVSRPLIPEPAFARASLAWSMAEHWQRACEFGSRVPRDVDDPYGAFGASGPPRTPDAVVGQRFDDLPDPMQPLLEVWRAGYVFEGVENGDVLLQFPV